MKRMRVTLSERGGPLRVEALVYPYDDKTRGGECWACLEFNRGPSSLSIMLTDWREAKAILDAAYEAQKHLALHRKQHEEEG